MVDEPEVQPEQMCRRGFESRAIQPLTGCYTYYTILSA
jgi:hypothetical protein